MISNALFSKPALYDSDVYHRSQGSFTATRTDPFIPAALSLLFALFWVDHAATAAVVPLEVDEPVEGEAAEGCSKPGPGPDAPAARSAAKSAAKSQQEQRLWQGGLQATALAAAAAAAAAVIVIAAAVALTWRSTSSSAAASPLITFQSNMAGAKFITPTAAASGAAGRRRLLADKSDSGGSSSEFSYAVDAGVGSVYIDDSQTVAKLQFSTDGSNLQDADLKLTVSSYAVSYLSRVGNRTVVAVVNRAPGA